MHAIRKIVDFVRSEQEAAVQVPDVLSFCDSAIHDLGQNFTRPSKREFTLDVARLVQRTRDR